MLDVMTQGHTRTDALRMIADLIATMVDEEGFSVAVNSGASGVITIEASNAGPLAAVMHRRQREEHGPYQADAARRPGSRSAVPFARYEMGRPVPSIARFPATRDHFAASPSGLPRGVRPSPGTARETVSLGDSPKRRR